MNIKWKQIEQCFTYPVIATKYKLCGKKIAGLKIRIMDSYSGGSYVPDCFKCIGLIHLILTTTACGTIALIENCVQFFSFYRWENWGRGLSNLPKVTRPGCEYKVVWL